MGNLQIKNLPAPLHEELRRRARQRGQTLRDYVLELIRRDQLLPTPEDWLEEVKSLPPVDLHGTDVADVVSEGRMEREESLMRTGPRSIGDGEDAGSAGRN